MSDSPPRAPDDVSAFATERRRITSSPAPSDAAVADLLNELLRRSHLSAPSDLAAVIADQAGRIGAHDVGVYLIDYEQRTLLALPGSHGSDLAPLSVTGTIAGRAFATTSILRSSSEDGGGQRLWLPLLDGTERLGVMAMSFDDAVVSERTAMVCERYAHLTAMLVVTKAAYGDVFEVTRRRRPMTIASELLWHLTPPLVFATDRLVLGAMLEPCYDNGGDALDYAVNDGVLHVGVFDAMGHGLAAAGVAAFAVSAYRHSRRRGCGLLETYVAMDDAVREQFPGDRYVTAVIGQLDLTTGRLAWISAGHPPPLIVRDGRLARTLSAPPAAPLGIPLEGPQPVLAEESLEPGDLLLLYTDGLTEARHPDGQMFTVAGLGEFIEREAAAGQVAPETLRRLRHAIVDRQPGPLRDDATAVLVEWRRGTEVDLLPQTAHR
jgi:serine/threonine protein phosphatase PrpC